MRSWQELIYALTIKPKLNKLKKLLPEASIHPTGSRYVCNPPVMTTDIDFVVHSEREVSARLLDAGYEFSVHPTYTGSGGDAFTSWRKGRINVIVSVSRKFYEQHILAGAVCKDRNVRRKYHRILIHEALRGNYDPKNFPPDFPNEILALLDKFTGPHGAAMCQVYRIQKGLEHEL